MYLLPFGIHINDEPSACGKEDVLLGFRNDIQGAKALTAMVGALRAQGLSRVDELRRHIEDLPPEDYDRPYFERWAEALCDLLEEKGLTSRAEIEARMATIKAALEARQ